VVAQFDRNEAPTIGNVSYMNKFSVHYTLPVPRPQGTKAEE
jgi:hypothetical protein